MGRCRVLHLTRPFNLAARASPPPLAPSRSAVHLFAADPGVRVALLSVTAAGVGLDFSAASVVVFVGERGYEQIVCVQRVPGRCYLLPAMWL